MKKTTSISRGKKFLKDYGGYVYVLPVIIGIICFTLIPMVISLIYSFCDYKFYEYEISNMYTNFGFQNYIRIFTSDWKDVGNSLFITFRYAILMVVTGLVGSYILALFLNQKIKGVAAFRIVYYLPCIIPAVAGTLLWRNITDVNTGYINLIFQKIGLPAYTFYSAKSTVLPTILLLSVTGWGGNMVMWLAQMKNIPQEMYEVADLDGANYFQKLLRITLPMTTSMIFYLFITSVIGSLQVFGAYYPLMTGINRSELNFIVIKIYTEGFVNYDMSYASALSWLLFMIIGILTLTIFKTSKWVYYGEEI